MLQALKHEYFNKDPIPSFNAFKPPGNRDVLVRYPNRPRTGRGLELDVPKQASHAEAHLQRHAHGQITKSNSSAVSGSFKSGAVK